MSELPTNDPGSPQLPTVEAARRGGLEISEATLQPYTETKDVVVLQQIITTELQRSLRENAGVDVESTLVKDVIASAIEEYMAMVAHTQNTAGWIDAPYRPAMNTIAGELADLGSLKILIMELHNFVVDATSFNLAELINLSREARQKRTKVVISNAMIEKTKRGSRTETPNPVVHARQNSLDVALQTALLFKQKQELDTHTVVQPAQE